MDINRNILPTGTITEADEAWIGSSLPPGFSRPEPTAARTAAITAAVMECIEHPGMWRLIKVYPPQPAQGTAKSAYSSARGTARLIEGVKPSPKYNGTDWRKIAAQAGGHFETVLSEPDDQKRITMVARFILGTRGS